MGRSRRTKKPRTKLSFITGIVVMCCLLFVANALVQFVRKPAEVISLVGWAKSKSLAGTWVNYGELFEYHSTATMTPTFLAAMAQAESAGNPLATPKWKLRFTDRLFRIFSPASTSVGLFQFTDGTFERAKNYCVRNRKAYSKGCWFSAFSWRTSASDSIEAASAYLTVAVNEFQRIYGPMTERQQRRLASVVHLCGLRKGKKFVKSKFSLIRMKSCGSHNVANYVNKIESLERRFRKIAISRAAQVEAY